MTQLERYWSARPAARTPVSMGARAFRCAATRAGCAVKPCHPSRLAQHTPAIGRLSWEGWHGDQDRRLRASTRRRRRAAQRVRSSSARRASETPARAALGRTAKAAAPSPSAARAARRTRAVSRSTSTAFTTGAATNAGRSTSRRVRTPSQMRWYWRVAVPNTAARRSSPRAPPNAHWSRGHACRLGRRARADGAPRGGALVDVLPRSLHLLQAMRDRALGPLLAFKAQIDVPGPSRSPPASNTPAICRASVLGVCMFDVIEGVSRSDVAARASPSASTWCGVGVDHALGQRASTQRRCAATARPCSPRII